MAVSVFGWQTDVNAAQFFEFDFEVSGYQDTTLVPLPGDEFTSPDTFEPTDSVVNISIAGTDNNADGLLEVRQYSGIWRGSFGTITHNLDDALVRGFSTVHFSRSTLEVQDLDIESHPPSGGSEAIVLGRNGPNPNSYLSFLRRPANVPYGEKEEECKVFDASLSPCNIKIEAKAVPEHLGPLASMFVLGIGVALKKKFNSHRATFER
ncbi:hypothetical protein [Acaryochloris sp. IP29b_bin.148]|uniref:hypothetical protein n=1 Tax=Acaryochloris sp. IP29b_bin.148 TaxID=2969218 RepID=UPI00260FE321|nr:hypothetical protein [Acaryochloris sp. IP29b_bin.148]